VKDFSYGDSFSNLFLIENPISTLLCNYWIELGKEENKAADATFFSSKFFLPPQHTTPLHVVYSSVSFASTPATMSCAMCKGIDFLLPVLRSIWVACGIKLFKLTKNKVCSNLSRIYAVLYFCFEIALLMLKFGTGRSFPYSLIDKVAVLSTRWSIYDQSFEKWPVLIFVYAVAFRWSNK
jgi:hypothetical protein